MRVTICWADCASVVASGADREAAIGPKRPFAGLWLAIPPYVEVRKTKAHRTREQAEASDDLANWHGNEHADQWAKQGAQLGAPVQWQRTAWLAHASRVRHAIRAASSYLSEWPRVSDLLRQGLWQPPFTVGDGEAKPRPPGAARRAVDATHSWTYSPLIQAELCRACGTRRSVRQMRVCPVAPLDAGSIFARGLRVHHTHRPFAQLREQLEAGGEGPPLIYCRECGCYSVYKVVGLADPCAGHPRHRATGAASATDWGGWQTRVRRARRGLHPVPQSPDWAPCHTHVPLVAYAGLTATAPDHVTEHDALRMIIPGHLFPSAEGEVCPAGDGGLGTNGGCPLEGPSTDQGIHPDDDMPYTPPDSPSLDDDVAVAPAGDGDVDDPWLHTGFFE